MSNDGRDAFEELEKNMDKTGRSIKRTKAKAKQLLKRSEQEKTTKECRDSSSKTPPTSTNDS